MKKNAVEPAGAQEAKVRVKAGCQFVRTPKPQPLAGIHNLFWEEKKFLQNLF